MKKVKVKHPDIFQLAHAIGEAATDESEQEETVVTKVPARRRGGLKGGKTRADKLTRDQRKEIAKIAATARWKKDES